MSKSIETTLSDQELVDHCHFLLDDFCDNGFKSGHWTMRIPAEPNRDPDIVFNELLNRFDKLRASAHNSDYAKCPVCSGEGCIPSDACDSAYESCKRCRGKGHIA